MNIKTVISMMSLIPAAVFANSYQESIERLNVKDPELVIYMNVENDFETLGQFASEIYLAYLKANPSAAPIPINFSSVFQRLGLKQIDEVFVTSSPDDSGLGFLNQTLSRLNEEPTGLWTLYGTVNKPFTVQEKTPASFNIVAEFGFNAPALLAVVRQIATDVMGPMGSGLIDAQISNPITEDGLTIKEIINQLSTRVYLGIDSQTIDLNRLTDESQIPAMISQIDGFILIDNAADLLVKLDPILSQKGLSKLEEDGIKTSFVNIPMGNSDPLKVFFTQVGSTNELMISFNTKTLKKYTSEGPRFSSRDDFQKYASAVPSEGISMAFSSAEASQLSLFQLDSAIEQLPENSKQMGEIVKKFMKNFIGPNISVGYFEGNDYRTKAIQPASLKSTIGMFVAIVPAMMAYGAFENVRAVSQEKAVVNNLRQIAAAAQQYMLEEGVTEASIDQLVGPDAYIDYLEPVAGESYEGMIISMEDSTISVTLPDGRVISYSF